MSTTSRYNEFPAFLKRYFPYKVQKISLNAGFTCPNRDGNKGYSGCTYCNNQTFNPDYCRTEKPICLQLEEGKRFFAHKYPEMKYLAYFQAYTNTYGELESLKRKYEEALSVEGTGGNFSYYELGNSLFVQDGTINDEVDITEVRKYVWYTETNGIEYNEDTQEKYFLGSYNDTAYYFYYEKDRVTILDYELLTSVHKKEQAYVMYADSCALSDGDLQKWNITFKKIPRDIEHI